MSSLFGTLHASENALSEESLSKLDPWLVLAMQAPRSEGGGLEAVGKRLTMYGESVDEVVFPVLIRSELDDASLATMGAIPQSRVGDIITARVKEADLDRIASHPLVDAIEGSYRMHSFLDISIPEVRADLAAQAGYDGEGVLYALIDDGLDLSHDDFRNAQGGSRVLYVWDHFTAGTPPAGFDYGAEWTQQQINAGQASEFVNEGGHGSHVAGISVGDGSAGSTSYRGVAPEADLIVVRNGGCDLFCYGGGPYEQSTVGSIDALNYLAAKANALGKPMVINQSQGVTMGPHDGTSLFEQSYNQIINQQDIIIAVAAGNDQTANWHSKGTVPSNGTHTFTMVHSDDPNSGGPLNFIQFEIWYPAGRQFTYRIQDPQGGTYDVASTFSGEVPGPNGDVMALWTSTSHPANGQGGLAAVFYDQAATLTTGNWQITVQSVGGSSGQVDFYAERNQYAVQLVNPDLEAIVAMPGSADEVITVASYNTRFAWPSQNGQSNAPDSNPIGDISSFSSQGPRRDGGQKPDIGAPGMWIVSSLSADHQTQAGFISPDGMHHALSGTSMACPHVAGAIALMLQADPTLTHQQVKSVLASTARKDGFTGGSWGKEFGHGKLDVKAAVDAVGGGSGNCPTATGDANVNSAVDVVDVVATVNHILGSQSLTKEGAACADVTGDSQITVGDVTGIVGIILNAGEPIPQFTDLEPEQIAWGEVVEESSYQLLLDPAVLSGAQLVFMPPKGFQMAGDPVLHGAVDGISVVWTEELGQYTVLVYHAGGGRLASGGAPVTVEIPLERLYDSGAGIDRFAVTRLELAGPQGRPLALEREPSLEPDDAIPGGIASYLADVVPNPMREITHIRYDLERSGPVQARIYDATGREVRKLWDGYQVGGAHTLSWDGTDENGALVSEGVYFVRVRSESLAESRKILLVR